MDSQFRAGIKHHVRRINIPLFVVLFGLIAGVDVQANDNIELAGDVLMIALPSAASGLTLGFRDGQGAQGLGKSAALALGESFI